MTNNKLTDERLSALIRVARDSLELYEMELPVIDDVMLALAELQRHRAAMLQGKADDNSPVIAHGWVACSERMPDIGTEIFYFCQDDGLRDCGIVSSSNFSGKGDAQLYVHAEGYDLRFGVDITHWMPMPAAPQQEVKS